ncbi:YciI family protein [Mycolicibacterium tusciae]|uniref:YciI family protein n=1 Tax=Mycolicibacterium tusciae TaxID=75922 RepID=UPI00024A36CA|nr:YciI family protein [Mycolicibacterium tusciae]
MFHVLKSTYLQPPDVVNQTRPAHLEWLKGEVAAGRIVLAGRLEDESGAILLTGDISAEEAQAIVERDPYTVAEVATYERLSFNGAFRAPGL